MATIRFCTNDVGQRLAYTSFGSGPVLLVPPPWISSLEVQLDDPAWLELFERLARTHTVVTYDKIGCGLSEPVRTDYSLARDVADALTVVAQLPPDRFDVFGFSQGGLIGMGVAAQRPDRVGRLVLYGSYRRGRDITPDGGSALVDLVRRSWGLGSRAFATLFLPESLDDPTAMSITLRWERAATTREEAARLLTALFSWDATEVAAALEVPTLVLHRRQDRAFPVSVGRDLAATIPGARFVLLEGDGHLPWYGDTDAFLRPVAEFLGDDPAEVIRPASAGAAAALPLAYTEKVDRIDLTRAGGAPKGNCRVGIAQLALADHLVPVGGMLGLPQERVAEVRSVVRDFVTRAHAERVDLLLFPEMSVDLKVPELRQDVVDLARSTGMIIVPGSYHDVVRHRNVSTVIGPEGVLWEQEKQLPAILTLAGQQFIEPIPTVPKPLVIANTRFGRIAIVICRDFLDLDVRVALRRADPAVDIVLNPAFTPVTADFQAAHFEARRSLFAYCFFCNVAEFGGSAISTPEKSRGRRPLKAGQQGLIWKDLDLVELRAQREHWAEVRGPRRFIQSTR